MNQIYILGAGASHELSFSSETYDAGYNTHTKRYHSIKGPLSSGFFYYGNEFAKEVPKFSPFSPSLKIYDKWLINFIETTYQITLQDLFENEGKSRRVNIEDLYTKVEQELEKAKPQSVDLEKYAEIYWGWNCLIKFIYDTISTIPFYCYSLFHRILAHWISQNGGHIISFNWDTLLDDELYEIGGCWDYSDGYDIKPAGIIDKNWLLKIEGSVYKPAGASKHLVLKPHGSINWYTEIKEISQSAPPSDEIHIGIALARKGFWRSGTTVSCSTLQYVEFLENRQFNALLVPPGVKRKTFTAMWKKIASLLTQADEINVIGFSLNNFDSHIVEEFKQIKLKTGTMLNVIDPDESVLQRYKELFPETKIQAPFKRFSEYCQWIVQQPGMEKFSDLASELFKKPN